LLPCGSRGRNADSARVCALFCNALAEARELPVWVTVDHDPEVTGQVLDVWAYSANVRLSFIRQSKPDENAYVESFNGKITHDECLNEQWFA